VLLAKLTPPAAGSATGDTVSWHADCSVRRFIRPTLLPDPQLAPPEGADRKPRTMPSRPAERQPAHAVQRGGARCAGVVAAPPTAGQALQRQLGNGPSAMLAGQEQRVGRVAANPSASPVVARSPAQALVVSSPSDPAEREAGRSDGVSWPCRPDRRPQRRASASPKRRTSPAWRHPRQGLRPE
jgi:hypothetical protein